MHALGVFLLHTLAVLFLTGLAGSAVVVLITFVQDLGELFGSDSAPETRRSPPPAAATRQKL